MCVLRSMLSLLIRRRQGQRFGSGRLCRSLFPAVSKGPVPGCRSGSQGPSSFFALGRCELFFQAASVGRLSVRAPARHQTTSAIIAESSRAGVNISLLFSVHCRQAQNAPLPCGRRSGPTPARSTEPARGPERHCRLDRNGLRCRCFRRCGQLRTVLRHRAPDIYSSESEEARAAWPAAVPPPPAHRC